MNGDVERLARIRNGAEDEFAELVRRHQAQVFGILGRYERDAHRLEDLAQETFLKVWKSLDRFDGRAPFEHWLSRITVNVALDHLRRQKRARAEIGFEDLGENAVEWLAKEGTEPDLAASEAREILERAMACLSPADRLVITLQEIEGRSVKEISALMGSSGVAVRVRALRARAKLKKALEKLQETSK